MKLVLIAGMAAMMMATSAMADEMILDVGSIHSKCRTAQGEEYNNFNYGIGYAKTINDNFAIGIDVYNNSFNKTSLYVGFEGVYPITDKFAIGVVAGGATGYESIKHKKVIFIPALEVKYEFTEHLIGVVQYTDSSLVCDRGVGVAHFQIRYRF